MEYIKKQTFKKAVHYQVIDVMVDFMCTLDTLGLTEFRIHDYHDWWCRYMMVQQ